MVNFPESSDISLLERKASSTVLIKNSPEYTLISAPSLSLVTLNPFELIFLL